MNSRNIKLYSKIQESKELTMQKNCTRANNGVKENKSDSIESHRGIKAKNNVPESSIKKPYLIGQEANPQI